MSEAKGHFRESVSAIGDVFRNRNLRRLNLALAGSVIGDWAWSVALGVYAYKRGGPATLGAIGVVRYVSMSLLAPLVAVAADKFDRRRVMLTADLARVVTTVGVALLALADGPALLIYGLAILNSWIGLAFRPAEAAMMPSLANTPSELTASNVASKTIHSVGFFVGPAIAGLLLAFADVSWVFLFDSATFLWSAALVFGLPRGSRGGAAVPTSPEAAPGVAEPGETAAGETAPEEEQVKKAGFFAGAGDGYRAIFANRDLRLLITLYIAQTVVAGASAVFEVAIALDMLDMGDSGVGVLNAALGVGGIVGGMVALLLAQRGKLARDFGLGVGLWAAPLLLVAAWPTVPSALIALGLIGLGNSVVDVNAETIIQRLVPDDVLGRVFGAMDSAIIGGMAVGALAMPLLIETVGLRTGLTVIGVAISLVVVVTLSGLSRIDRTALAPEGLELVRSVPMFGVLPEKLIERLARSSTVFRFAAGDTVFAEGDSGDFLYIIAEGTVDVTIGGAYRRTLGAGDAFGEIALLRDVPRTATIVATSELVLRGIERRHFLPAVVGHESAQTQAETVVGRWLATS